MAGVMPRAGYPTLLPPGGRGRYDFPVLLSSPGVVSPAPAQAFWMPKRHIFTFFILFSIRAFSSVFTSPPVSLNCRLIVHMHVFHSDPYGRYKALFMFLSHSLCWLCVLIIHSIKFETKSFFRMYLSQYNQSKKLHKLCTSITLHHLLISTEF